MAYRPFSLFVRVEDLTPAEQADLANRPNSVLDGIGFTFYADLYRALAPVMSPSEADEQELWQIGAILGVDRKEPSDDGLARIVAAQAGGEGPVDVTAQVLASMGLATR